MPKHEWTPDLNMDSIPWDALVSEFNRRRGAMAVGTGRKRGCGHTKWVPSCDTCLANFKRTQRRLGNEIKAGTFSAKRLGIVE